MIILKFLGFFKYLCRDVQKGTMFFYAKVSISVIGWCKGFSLSNNFELKLSNEE